MHRGCIVWTPTPPLFYRRTPRPGPACVCVRAPLGRVGRAGLPGVFWCASPSLVAAYFALLFCLAPSGPGLPCLCLFSGFCFLFFFFFYFFAPPLSLSFCVFLPGVPWALTSCGPPAEPPLFFFFFFFFCLFPSPPPPPRLFFFCPSCSWFFAAFLFFCLGVPVLRCLGWFVCPALWGVLMCVAVGLVPRRGPFCACACSVCVVACLAAVFWCVLCFARCCVVCLCWAWFFPRAAAPCCRCLVPCRGPWLCSLLGCGAALLWWSFVVLCGAVFVVSCSCSRVVSFAPAGAVCCCLRLLAVRCWVWLPAVVFRWRLLSRLLLPGRVPCRAAVCCGLLWCAAPLLFLL